MYFTRSEKGYILRVRLTPNSSSCRFSGTIEGPDQETYLRVNVISVPEKGKANKELTAFLAKKLGIAKSLLEVISGTTDRWKKILIETSADLDEKLTMLAGE